jgi:glycerol uptake facilitator-like aquaporin
MDEPEELEETQEFSGGLLRYTVKQPISKRTWPFGLHETLKPVIWRASIIEFFGTLQLTFVSTLSVVAAVNFGESSRIQVGGIIVFNPASVGSAPWVYVAIVNGLLLILMIFSTAAPSGAHLNPLISLATCFTGLSSVPRTILYIIAQIGGRSFF